MDKEVLQTKLEALIRCVHRIKDQNVSSLEVAAGTGHVGGDFWMIYNFLDYIRNDKEPFFNVYRGVAMSAVGILGWRSCMEDGKTFRIPDFRVKSDRDAVRNDDLTPFPDEKGHVTLPCASSGRSFLRRLPSSVSIMKGSS